MTVSASSTLWYYVFTLNCCLIGKWHIVPPTVYPKKYAHGFCFAVLCCGYTLTDFPISIRLTSLALWQSNDCPSASKATLMNMDKYFMWIHYEWLHNHNKAKHNKTVCTFLGIYCISFSRGVLNLDSPLQSIYLENILNVFLHGLHFLHTDMVQVVEICFLWRQGKVNPSWQHYGCWWPGVTSSQGISSNDINLIWPETMTASRTVCLWFVLKYTVRNISLFNFWIIYQKNK